VNVLSYNVNKENPGSICFFTELLSTSFVKRNLTASEQSLERLQRLQRHSKIGSADFELKSIHMGLWREEICPWRCLCGSMIYMPPFTPIALPSKKV
jgi:hypothetical protein